MVDFWFLVIVHLHFLVLLLMLFLRVLCESVFVGSCCLYLLACAMSSGGASSGGAVGGVSFVKRAVVLRVKYLVAEIAGLGGRRLTPDLGAPHPLNRNGVRLNGHRCEELFMQVFRKYDPREASHGCGVHSSFSG